MKRRENAHNILSKYTRKLSLYKFMKRRENAHNILSKYTRKEG